MKARFIIFYLFILFSPAGLSGMQSQTDSLLRVLDQVVDKRVMYSQQKESELQAVKDLLRIAPTEEQKFAVYSQLFSGYLSFNNDSALYYANKKVELALLLGGKKYLEDARISLAEVLCVASMYKESLDIMDEVDISEFPELRPAYYHVYRRLYQFMAGHAVTAPEKERYVRLTDIYQDSMLIANAPGSFTHILITADKLILQDEGDKAAALLLEYQTKTELNMHDDAVLNYVIANAYEHNDELEVAMYHYTISALSDLRSAVKEYISLRQLSHLLFEKGDIDRAYSYLKCSMEDAIECNARNRAIEVSQIFPLIDNAYQYKAEKQRQLARLFLLSVSLLSLSLLVAFFFIYRQMRKTSLARQAVNEANDQLRLLNGELNASNLQLQHLNNTLSETNHIKEEYIGRYMDICSTYIDKMDEYRRSLAKIAGTGKVDELYKKIKSTQFLEDDLKEFYVNFDNAFLQLFPTFVEDFNELLTESILPKAGEKLNTELRIFALIRLGITDSNKIARFLRYSVTTIYNYRTRIRNKAKGERDDFENKVMNIGRVFR